MPAQSAGVGALGGRQLQRNVAESAGMLGTLGPSVHFSPPSLRSSPAGGTLTMCQVDSAGGEDRLQGIEGHQAVLEIGLEIMLAPNTSFCSVGALRPGHGCRLGPGQRARRNPELERAEGSQDVSAQTKRTCEPMTRRERRPEVLEQAGAARESPPRKGLPRGDGSLRGGRAKWWRLVERARGSTSSAGLRSEAQSQES